MLKSLAVAVATVTALSTPAQAFSASCGVHASSAFPHPVDLSTAGPATVDVHLVGETNTTTAALHFNPCPRSGAKYVDTPCWSPSVPYPPQIALSQGSKCLASTEAGTAPWTRMPNGDLQASIGPYRPMSVVTLVCDSFAKFGTFTVKKIKSDTKTFSLNATLGVLALCNAPGFPLFAIESGSEPVFASTNNLFIPKNGFTTFNPPLYWKPTNNGAAAVPGVDMTAPQGSFLISSPLSGDENAAGKRQLAIASPSPSLQTVPVTPVQGSSTEALCSNGRVLAATTPIAADMIEVLFSDLNNGVSLGGVTLPNSILSAKCSSSSFIFLTRAAGGSNGLSLTIVSASTNGIPMNLGSVGFRASGIVSPAVAISADGALAVVVADGTPSLVNLRTGALRTVGTLTTESSRTGVHFSGNKLVIVPAAQDGSLVIYNVTSAPSATSTNFFGRTELAGATLTVLPTLTSGFVVSSPINGATYGFDNHGSHSWTVHPRKPSTVAVSKSGKTVVVVTPGHGIAAYSAATGQQLWSTTSFDIPTSAGASVSVAFVSGGTCAVRVGGALYAFSMTP